MLPSFPRPVLVYMEHPYRVTKWQCIMVLWPLVQVAAGGGDAAPGRVKGPPVGFRLLGVFLEKADSFVARTNANQG